MLFLILSIVLFVLTAGLVVGAIGQFAEVSAIIAGVLGAWFQTHRIVPTQQVGISKSTFSQELAGLYPSGLAPKPFFGAIYTFPSSSDLERCEQFTPAIKGSYGITVDLCFYYDAGNINWLDEVNDTGFLNANQIMQVWRNSVVGDVAKSVKSFTPEALSDNRSRVEAALFENVSPWFVERGIPLSRVSFKNWDFTSTEVAQAFDASIVSQRKITEQTALLEAAKISREREVYEAETTRLVADLQKQSLNLLGFEGSDAVQYLWIKLMADNDRVPDTVILGRQNTPISVPAR
jgi:hypothetical protein